MPRARKVFIAIRQRFEDVDQVTAAATAAGATGCYPRLPRSARAGKTILLPIQQLEYLGGRPFMDARAMLLRNCHCGR